MNSIDLRGLETFVAVARTRNFRRAAQELGVSVSSLSQRLRELEEALDVRLMNRTTRSVGLTEAGDLLLARVAPALTSVDEAFADVRNLRGIPSGRLRVNAPPPVIDLILAPMIAPFLSAYPEIELEVVADTAFVDIVATGFDAGVRYGEHLDQDMIAVPLGPPQKYVVVASPQYIQQQGRPKHPQDLLRHSTIRFRSNGGYIPDWEFEKTGRAVKVAPTGKLIASHPALAKQAALDGVGLWPTFEGYVSEDIRAGALVSVLEDWIAPFPGPFLYYPSRRRMPAALGAFVAFVAKRRIGT